jgi:hypothetical protein
MCARRLNLAAQRVRLVVGQPHRRQVVGRQQLREHLGVDRVGLDLGLGDRARLRRVGHDHARHASLEQARDRVRVARRLQRDLIAGHQAVGEQPQRLRCRRDPPHLPDHARLPDRDLPELAMHIKPNAPTRHCLTPFDRLDAGEPAGKRHLRIRARSATGRVAGAAKY